MPLVQVPLVSQRAVTPVAHSVVPEAAPLKAVLLQSLVPKRAAQEPRLEQQALPQRAGAPQQEQ